MSQEIGYVKGNLLGWGGFTDDSNELNPLLRWPQSIEVFDQMRREDAQVGSVLRAVTLPIRSTRWEIDPAGASDEVTTFIAQNLGLPVKGEAEPPRPHRERGRFSFKDFLRLALLELVFGHSVFEQVYEIVDRRACLQKLAWRPPRTIAKFEVAKDGGLIAIEQRAIYGTKNVRIPVERLVVFVNDREGADWVGRSLLREAYKDWKLKDRFLRIQTLAAERNGLGIPAYTAPEVPAAVAKDATKTQAWQDAQRKDGLELTQDFRAGEAAAASLPHGSKLELIAVTGNLPDMAGPIRYHDAQIAKAVLAHLLTLGGDDSTGSYALGDTFEDFFTGSLNALQDHIADVVQQHVVEDLVDLNWGANEPAPRIVPAPLGKSQPVTAEAIRALIESGAFTADYELEKALRAQYGLPAPPERVEDNVSRAEAAKIAAEVAQKVYLATDKVVLRQDEARALVSAAGGDLEGTGPDVQRVPDARMAEEAA